MSSENETGNVLSFKSAEELLAYIFQPEKTTVTPHTLEPVKKMEDDIVNAINSYMDTVEEDDSSMETVLAEICSTLSKYLCGTALFGNLPLTSLLAGVTNDYRKQEKA